MKGRQRFRRKKKRNSAGDRHSDSLLGLGAAEDEDELLRAPEGEVRVSRFLKQLMILRMKVLVQ